MNINAMFEINYFAIIKHKIMNKLMLSNLITQTRKLNSSTFRNKNNFKLSHQQSVCKFKTTTKM